MCTPHPLGNFTVFEQLHIRCWVGSFSSCTMNAKHWSLLRANPTSSSKLPGHQSPWNTLGVGRRREGIPDHLLEEHLSLDVTSLSLPVASRSFTEAWPPPGRLWSRYLSLMRPSRLEPVWGFHRIVSCDQEGKCLCRFFQETGLQDNTDFPEKKCLCFFVLKYTVFNASIFKWVTI